MSAPGSIWSREAPAKLVVRIRRLAPDGAPSWGNLTAAAMVVHLSDQLRMALCEIPLGPPRGWLRFEPLRTLVVHWLPWPKGRAKAPREAFTTSPTSWQTDLETLLALLERFSQASPERLSLSHPTFGRMSPRDWGTLSYRHFDHHLRQFRC